MKAINLIIVIVGLAAIVFWYAPTAMWGLKISKLTASMGNGNADPGKFTEQLGELMEGPAPLAWLRNRSKVAGYFSLEQFTKVRTVSFSQSIPFKDLLNSDEDMPDSLYYEAYATARAASYLKPSCDVMLETIANACKTYISSGRATVPNSGDVRAKVSLEIAYLPSYPLGDPSLVKNGRFRTGSIMLRFQDLKDKDENQRLVLQRAVDVCAKLREIYGNCIIKNVFFDHDTVRVYKANKRVSKDEITSNIRLAVYANTDKVDHNGIQEAVTSISDSFPKLAGQM